MLAALSTVELLGIVMLVTGPVLTLFALRFDRQCAAKASDRSTQSMNGHRNPSRDCAHTQTKARTATHDAHTRQVPLPTRAGETHGDPRTHEHAA